jgi:hypothetical protein
MVVDATSISGPRLETTGWASLPWLLEWVKTFQNNAHHLEGWLYNHIILMLVALKEYRGKISDKSYAILERAIFWSDLGKLHTCGEGKKLWEDGTPMSTAFGHDKKSAELLDEAIAAGGAPPDWYTPVRWLVANHMKAHQMMEFIKTGLNDKGKFSKKVGDFRVIPDFLQHLADVDAWDWPEYDTFDVSIQNLLNKQTYQWMNLWHSDLLRIKQDCDSKGRISDLDF